MSQLEPRPLPLDWPVGASPRKPRVDPSRCVACGECVPSCPRQAIQEPITFACAKCVKYCMTLEVPCNPSIPVVCRDLCDGCGLCLPACPHQAISWGDADEPGR